MTRPALSSPACDLLRDAAQWCLLGRLFERPAGSWWRETLALAATSDAPALRSAVAFIPPATEGDYLAVLGPGGIVSPRETAHRAASDPGHVLAELGAFYEAFSFRPGHEESPDHVAVEAAFVAYLRLKEAYAAMQGDEEHRALTAEAAADFVAGHLAVVAGPLAEAFAASSGYLAIAARVLRDRTGPAPAAGGGWVPEGLADACLTCSVD